MKANLSSYLASVRKGETVVVYDRSTPIARLVPFEERDDFTVIEAVDPPKEARRLKPVKPLKAVDIDRYLQELREDKW